MNVLFVGHLHEKKAELYDVITFQFWKWDILCNTLRTFIVFTRIAPTFQAHFMYQMLTLSTFYCCYYVIVVFSADTVVWYTWLLPKVFWIRAKMAKDYAKFTIILRKRRNVVFSTIHSEPWFI